MNVGRSLLAAALAASCLTTATAADAPNYRIFDPLAVPVEGDARVAVLTVAKPAHSAVVRCDLVVAGGGMGGVAAALAGAHGGLRVCLTEVTNWLGGQMTSQGVSALDENRFIETTGATRTYQEVRRRIRAAYGAKLPGGQYGPRFNPGRCWVSALCFEPKVGLAILDELVRPFEKSGVLRILRRSTPVSARSARGRLKSILVYNFATRDFTELRGTVFVDATELGELLPLSGARFRTGAEARSETGEPDAAETADPQLLQSFTYPFVLSRDARNRTDILKPAAYDAQKAQFRLLAEYAGGRILRYGMFEGLPNTPGSFWNYRRLVAADQFPPATYPADFAMINWSGNDVCDAGYLSPDPIAVARAFQHGKQVSLGFAWWLRNEAPHDSDSGTGFPDVVLRPEVMGTADGLSLYPYIREARRMVGLRTIREQDLGATWHPGARAEMFDDSGGIGLYPIDIHGCGKPRGFPTAKPYQVPLGALISRDVPNLLAGGKNIATTHVTNGAYRLHPTEWAIGEAGGMLAAAAVRHQRTPAAIYRDLSSLRRLQRALLDAGHPLIWFDDVPPEHQAFADIQFAALTGLMPPAQDTLHFRPFDTVTPAESSAALRALKAQGITRRVPLAGATTRADFARWLCAQLPAPR